MPLRLRADAATPVFALADGTDSDRGAVYLVPGIHVPVLINSARSVKCEGLLPAAIVLLTLGGALLLYHYKI